MPSERIIGEYTMVPPDNRTSLCTEKKGAIEPCKDMEETSNIVGPHGKLKGLSAVCL